MYLYDFYREYFLPVSLSRVQKSTRQVYEQVVTFWVNEVGNLDIQKISPLGTQQFVDIALTKAGPVNPSVGKPESEAPEKLTDDEFREMVNSLVQMKIMNSKMNTPGINAVQFVADFVAKKQWKPTLIMLYAMLAMIAWKYLTVPIQLQQMVFEAFGQNPVTAFLLGSHKMIGGFFLFGIIPMLIVKLILREKLAEYGLRLGIVRRLLVNTLIFLPFVFMIGMLTGRDAAFWNVYPYNPVVSDAPMLFFCHTLTYLGYYFGWEFFFRGWMQHGLRDSFGIYNAILVQTMASAVLHFGHPMSETLGAIAGGLLWGFLVLRCRSLWAGLIQHSVLGITLDWFILQNRSTG
ncbi:MAG: CPBP family intramembrane metalloprotease [Planctomycetaceae bacterium]|nr:CPBP family intramembrane metalloprotease [Planctomycetaceae bacterium]